MTGRAGKNRTDYKKNNRGNVLRLISTGTCKTRPELTSAMGLSKMAISRIATEMMETHILKEEEPLRTDEPGRMPAVLTIDPRAPKVVGLLIQRDCVEAVLCDLYLTILQREKAFFSGEMDADSLLGMIYQILDTLLYEKTDVAAIGAASIGPVSSITGTILKPHFFFGIHDVPIVEKLRERYRLPVFLDHDNQCAALCESLYGNARGRSDILFVGVGTGVGCGIVSNGLPYRNKRGLPPEIGHVSIDVNGPKCLCGSRGCLELYARTPHVLKELRQKTGKHYTFKFYCGMRGNPDVDEIFERYVTRLAAAVVNAVNVLNSDMILLGQDAIDWDDRYVAMMEKIINERRYVEWEEPISVRKAHFGRDAALLGSACHVLTKMFDGQLLFDE